MTQTQTGARGGRARWRLDTATLIAMGIYLAVVAAMLVRAWSRSGGHFVYPLDDVYINMAVAKNFALHGVWGVTPYEFSSSTSSPLYILVLAAVYRVLGVNVYAPVVLSAGFGLAAIAVAAEMVGGLPGRARGYALGALVLLAPVFAVGVLGMEHALHLLLTLLFLRHLEDEGPAWRIGLLAALLTGVRYEGILMAAVATLVLLVRRRWVRAAVVACAAWVPVGMYAWFSLAHGGYWLPNSVAIKGIRVSGLGLAERLHGLFFVIGYNAQRGPHLPLLAVGLGVLTWALWRRERRLAGMLMVVTGACVLHVATADVGWAFRYETYLVGAAVVLAALALPKLSAEGVGFLVGTWVPLGAALMVLVLRSYLAATLLPEYSRAIYLQQWQTARFLTAAYPGASVAANDIGAINYMVDLHCLDLAGLASAEVFEAKRADEFTTEVIEGLGVSHRVQVAVAYDSWFSDAPAVSVLSGPPLPASWIRVRRWSVPEKQQLGGRTISWYALDAKEAGVLKGRLLGFESELPREVSVSD